MHTTLGLDWDDLKFDIMIFLYKKFKVCLFYKK